MANIGSVSLNQRVSGTPVNNVVTLSFPAPPLNRTWQGSVTIPRALATDLWNVTIGGQLQAVVQGSGPFGPIQVVSRQVLQLVGTVTLTTPYVAILSGIDDPADNATPFTGPTALPSAGLAFPQSLIGSFVVASATLVLPTNAETLWLFTTDVSPQGILSIVGTTTGKYYPFSPMPLRRFGGQGCGPNAIFVAAISPAADPSVTVTWTGACQWYAIADGATRQIVDQTLQDIVALGGSATFYQGLEVFGTDGTNDQQLRVNQQGTLYAIPSAPSTAGSDHPPNELQIISFFNLTTTTTIISAPGTGKRIRIFAAWISNVGSGDAALIANAAGSAFYALSQPGGSPVVQPLSGVPTPNINEAIMVDCLLGSVGIYIGAITYTVETV